MTYLELHGMRFAMVCGFGVASIASCATNELQPIRDPPSLDGASPSSPLGNDARVPDAGVAEVGALRDAGAGCKRGIAENAAPSAALAHTPSSPGIAWWYNWASQSPGGDHRIEFVPMIWGPQSLMESVPTGSRYMLGFNEPNFNKQANLTAQQAAAAWPQVAAKATEARVPVASPSVNFCGSPSNTSQCTDPGVTDPYTYLKDFFAACPGCKVDYIAVHAYQCDLPSLRAYLEGNVDGGGSLEGFVQFGKPVWLTELACDATHSASDQKAFMQAAVPYLENSPNVFRYAWFNASVIPNAVLTKSDGTLTDLGQTYVGLPQACQ